jgi:hypothetical protein
MPTSVFHISEVEDWVKEAINGVNVYRQRKGEQWRAEQIEIDMQPRGWFKKKVPDRLEVEAKYTDAYVFDSTKHFGVKAMSMLQEIKKMCALLAEDDNSASIMLSYEEVDMIRHFQKIWRERNVD